MNKKNKNYISLFKILIKKNEKVMKSYYQEFLINLLLNRKYKNMINIYDRKNK